MADAKRKLGLAIIGLVILLTSVVLVNTILRTLEFIGPEVEQIPGSGFNNNF